MHKYRNVVYLMILPFFIYNCSTLSHKESSTEINKKSDSIQKKLAFELCEYYGLDQGIRADGLSLNKSFNVVKTSKVVDSLSFYRIMNYIKKNGYPTKKLLGEYANIECVKLAPISILLHSSRLLYSSDDFKKILINEMTKGNLNEDTFVLFFDKYYWLKSKGEETFLGSQFGKPCIEKRSISDSLRKTLNLLPLDEKKFKKCNKE